MLVLDEDGNGQRVVVRATGYLVFVVALAAFMLAISIGAFLDPQLDGQRDPDWMFWLIVVLLSALIARAPFVGVFVSADTVRRRTWLRTQTWPADDIHHVGQSGYSGFLNRGSTSRRYRMVVLTVGPEPGREDVPELSGRPATVARYIARLTQALGTQETTGSGT